VDRPRFPSIDLRLRDVVLTAVAVGVVVAIWVLFLPLTHELDLHVFLRAGNAALHGRDIYPTVGTPDVYSGRAFVYPAVVVWPFALLAALPQPVAIAVYFTVCAFAVIAATIFSPTRDRWIPVLVLSTAFTITGLQLGAISPLLFVGAVFLWKLRGRPLLFGLLTALVIVSKLFLAPLLIWPLLAKRYRAVAWASSLTCLLLAFGFITGTLSLPGYLRLLAELASHEAGAGFGLIGALRNAGLSPLVAQAGALVLAAVVIAGAWAHHRRRGDERVLYCAGIVCALLLTPVLWSHYLVLLPAALLALHAERRWFVALAVVSWVMSPPHGLHWHLPVPDQLRSLGTVFTLTLLPLVLWLAIRGGSAGPASRFTAPRLPSTLPPPSESSPTG
jgi:alpha-1,2-mannosyltransferase